MKRRLTFALLIAAIGAQTFALTACSSERKDLLSLETCGSLVFPNGAKLVEFEQQTGFGDEVVTAVVEIPAGEMGEFKTKSGLAKFTAGVPKDWKYHWRDTKSLPLLESETAHRADEGQIAQTRWVAYTTKDTSEIVFIHAVC
ncbi:hypothetical protein [Nocardia neocaledoniensis]|uniref:hypothetical protein n=1 Tax=Nocardia neocaledoniensis TaxID=236511 RepID=UPI002458F3A3|nr:hypothetical protein [Nocardia neocaledoniensis]